MVCSHLAKRLRQDYPENYYRIVQTFLDLKIPLDWKCYPLTKLDATWRGFYEADVANYRATVDLYSKTRTEILDTRLVFNNICSNEEETEPVFKQKLVYPDITKVAYGSLELDSLNMVLLDAFLEPKAIKNAIKEVSCYFKEENPAALSETFVVLCLERIKTLMFLGVF